MTAGTETLSPDEKRLAELGYKGTERAETLSIAQHLQLCEAFGPEGANLETSPER